MSRNIRIIPRLDIKGPNLVKGIHLEGLRVLGKPEDFARYYYEAGADELLYIDIVASLYNRNSLHDIISKTAKEIFIPLTVGGGLRTIEDIKSVLRVGADKVSLNTAAIKNPDIIKKAARRFGSSTIVVSIEAIKQPDGRYLAYTDNGREYTGFEVLEWAKKVEKLGAGEILLTSVDNEGTGHGFDIELTKMVSCAVSIPVIAYGGAGKVEDIKDIIIKGEADAVGIASILHYNFIKECNNSLKPDQFKEEGNIEYLQSGREFSKFKTANIPQIKSYLHSHDICCRYVANNQIVNV
ncbi:MAG: imidazole glycerol phosphate synthase cyclase subunit [Candidatus Omnitrophota bacterium]|nr:imidazole glycerol phosphate synthase cyclase subunit [Candidatus Omnitrophota bacterium]